jgi:F0F1-type ATP synthase membrane subunit b/b'
MNKIQELKKSVDEAREAYDDAYDQAIEYRDKFTTKAYERAQRIINKADKDRDENYKIALEDAGGNVAYLALVKARKALEQEIGRRFGK